MTSVPSDLHGSVPLGNYQCKSGDKWKESCDFESRERRTFLRSTLLQKR